MPIDRASRRRKRDLATINFAVVPAESFFVIKTNVSRDSGFVSLNSEYFCKSGVNPFRTSETSSSQIPSFGAKFMKKSQGNSE
jgi:hypothetical protein